MAKRFTPRSRDQLLNAFSNEAILEDLHLMMKIRNFELCAENAYQLGKVGGFFHSYEGQEAIQTAAMRVIGKENWWVTTYRCHALALLHGVTMKEAMSELYGKANGNALGRGGSMHLYHDRFMGGFGIVGGHLPIAAGAAFALKYKQEKGMAVCFLGDGAVAQGPFHETLNMAALWDLPVLYVIENNQWGMGTAVDRAIAKSPIAKSQGPSYGIECFDFNGMDYFECLDAFSYAHDYINKEKKPVLIEAYTERFKGHSISDPGLYRSKDELNKAKNRDPIAGLIQFLVDEKIQTEEEIKKWNKELREEAIASQAFADESPWPNVSELEEGVFAP